MPSNLNLQGPSGASKMWILRARATFLSVHLALSKKSQSQN